MLEIFCRMSTYFTVMSSTTPIRCPATGHCRMTSRSHQSANCLATCRNTAKQDLCLSPGTKRCPSSSHCLGNGCSLQPAEGQIRYSIVTSHCQSVTCCQVQPAANQQLSSIPLLPNIDPLPSKQPFPRH